MMYDNAPMLSKVDMMMYILWKMNLCESKGYNYILKTHSMDKHFEFLVRKMYE